jgi:hypothetical protein
LAVEVFLWDITSFWGTLDRAIASATFSAQQLIPWKSNTRSQGLPTRTLFGIELSHTHTRDNPARIITYPNLRTSDDARIRLAGSKFEWYSANVIPINTPFLHVIDDHCSAPQSMADSNAHAMSEVEPFFRRLSGTRRLSCYELLAWI